MDSKRQLQFSKSLKIEIGEILQKLGLSIFNGFMLTITQVRISPDLKNVKVYLSVFGEGNKKEIIKKLEKEHASEIRYHLGNKLRNTVKAIPEMRYYLDDSLDYSEKIDSLLEEEKKKDK